MHFKVIDAKEKFTYRGPNVTAVKLLAPKNLIHRCNLIYI